MVLVHSFRRKKSSRNNDVMVSVGVARFPADLHRSRVLPRSRQRTRSFVMLCAAKKHEGSERGRRGNDYAENGSQRGLRHMLTL